MPSAQALDELQRWYLDQCDDDWEHSFGITIDTLDNPGWSIKIDLEGTALMGHAYERSEVHRSEHDWVTSLCEQGQWRAYCGPLNLEEALRRFLSWAAAA